MKVIECISDDESDIALAHERFLLELLEAAEGAKQSWDCVQLTLLSHNGGVRGTTLRTKRPFWYPQDEHDVQHAGHPEHFDNLIEVALQLDVPALDEGNDEDDDLDDSVLALKHARSVELRLNYLKRALKSRRLDSMRNGYFETARYGIQWTLDHEVHYECDFTPLEGKRLPRPPQPEGCVGVISRLLCAQHVALGPYNLSFDDGLLIGATLFGAEVNDRIVALLEDVEDVSRVCATLEVLRLEHSAITPKGIAQLRKLLPKVKLEIVT